MGSMGAGKTHLMLSLLGKRKELVNDNSTSFPQNADKKNDEKYLLLPIRPNPTKSIEYIILDLIKEVTNRGWDDLKQFNCFLELEKIRVVIIIDELNEWLYLRRDFQNELIAFMAQNTNLHSIFWFISIIDVSYDALVLNRKFWQRYSFVISSISNYGKIQRKYLSKQIPCVNGWLDLDAINFKDQIGFQIIQKNLQLEQNLSGDFDWLVKNWNFVTQFSNFTDTGTNDDQINNPESSIHYWSSPFIAKIILDLVREGEKIEKLIDLNFVGFASAFWEQKIRSFDISVLDVNTSEVDEIEMRDKVNNVSHFIAKFIVQSKNLSPRRRDLLNYLEKIANRYPDLIPTKVELAMKAFINENLLEQVTIEDSEFSNILSKQILIRFWPFWQWRLSQELVSLIKNNNLDAIKEQLEEWFNAVRLDIFREGVLEFLLLLLDEQKIGQNISLFDSVSNVWLLGLNSQAMPAAGVWFAGARASYDTQRFLGNLAITSVDLVPDPDEDKELRKLFAFIYFVMHALPSIFIPSERIKVLQKYYQSIQSFALADYFLYVIERLFYGVGSNSIILECMKYFSGCEVMGIASHLARLTINIISRNYDDPKLVLNLIIDYFKINQAELLSVRSPEVQKSEPYFYWEWVLRHFCRDLVKKYRQNVFEFLDESVWYDPERCGVDGYVAFKMKQEANLAIGYAYRSFWDKNEKNHFVYIVKNLVNTKQYKKQEIAFYLMRHTQSLTVNEWGKTFEPVLDEVFHPLLKNIFLDSDIRVQKLVDNHSLLFAINLKDDFTELERLRLIRRLEMKWPRRLRQ
jgi:hypothetical protein